MEQSAKMFCAICRSNQLLGQINKDDHSMSMLVHLFGNTNQDNLSSTFRFCIFTEIFKQNLQLLLKSPIMHSYGWKSMDNPPKLHCHISNLKCGHVWVRMFSSQKVSFRIFFDSFCIFVHNFRQGFTWKCTKVDVCWIYTPS
jgi:hypothetical protein